MSRIAWVLLVTLAATGALAEKPVRPTEAAKQLPAASPSVRAPAPTSSPPPSAAPTSAEPSPLPAQSEAPPTVPAPSAEPDPWKGGASLKPAKATPVTVTEEPDPAPAQVAGSADKNFNLFSPGGLILLVLSIACGAGVVMLHSKLKELDERLSGLKTLMARMKDSLASLEERGPGTPALPAAPAAKTAPAAGEIGPAVDRAVERALADARTQIERADARSVQLERDLQHVAGPAIDDLKRRVEAAERRVAESTRNPFSAHGGKTPEPASGGDPIASLAAGLARAHARLASRGPAQSGPVDPVAARMAESLEPLSQSLGSVDDVARAGSGPLEREVVELTARLTEFSRGVRQRAGHAVEPASAAPPLTLEQFVATYGDQLSADARTRPVILLSTYLEHVSRATTRTGGAAAPAGAPVSEQEMLAQVFTYVDVVHDLRTRAAAWDRSSSGSEQLSGTLDRLFDCLRNLLRAYSISVVAPEEGQMADASSVRVTSSTPRPSAQSHTVVRVVRCGFKNTLSGELIRMAEVITAS